MSNTIQRGRARGTRSKSHADAYFIAKRVVFFISSGGYEIAWQSMSQGITAAALGNVVIFVFSFDALRALARDAFGKPLTARERITSARAVKLGAQSPAQMLAEARTMGAQCIACDTTTRLCGLMPHQLKKKKILDDVLGLAQIWKLTEEARVFFM